MGLHTDWRTDNRLEVCESKLSPCTTYGAEVGKTMAGLGNRHEYGNAKIRRMISETAVEKLSLNKTACILKRLTERAKAFWELFNDDAK